MPASNPNPVVQPQAQSALSPRNQVILGLGALTAALFWSHWTTLATMADRWSRDPQYSHGFLVPVFAAVVLWSRRDRRPAWPPRPSWWGLPLLLAAVGLRLFAALVYLVPLDALSLLPFLAGLCLL